MSLVVNAMEDETQRIQEEIEGLRQMTTAQLKAK